MFIISMHCLVWYLVVYIIHEIRFFLVRRACRMLIKRASPWYHPWDQKANHHTSSVTRQLCEEAWSTLYVCVELVSMVFNSMDTIPTGSSCVKQPLHAKCWKDACGQKRELMEGNNHVKAIAPHDAPLIGDCVSRGKNRKRSCKKRRLKWRGMNKVHGLVPNNQFLEADLRRCLCRLYPGTHIHTHAHACMKKHLTPGFVLANLFNRLEGGLSSCSYIKSRNLVYDDGSSTMSDLRTGFYLVVISSNFSTPASSLTSFAPFVQFQWDVYIFRPIDTYI